MNSCQTGSQVGDRALSVPPSRQFVRYNDMSEYMDSYCGKGKIDGFLPYFLPPPLLSFILLPFFLPPSHYSLLISFLSSFPPLYSLLFSFLSSFPPLYSLLFSFLSSFPLPLLSFILLHFFLSPLP